jgi:hypothetical protein
VRLIVINLTIVHKFNGGTPAASTTGEQVSYFPSGNAKIEIGASTWVHPLKPDSNEI